MPTRWGPQASTARYTARISSRSLRKASSQLKRISRPALRTWLMTRQAMSITSSREWRWLARRSTSEVAKRTLTPSAPAASARSTSSMEQRVWVSTRARGRAATAALRSASDWGEAAGEVISM